MLKHGRFSPSPCATTQSTFAVEFCGGFQLALNCARLSNEQDFFARPMRSLECAIGVLRQERDPGLGQLADSHPPTPSRQLSPKVTRRHMRRQVRKEAAQL